MQCAGCFSLDERGVGTCRGVLTQLDEDEMAGALGGAASAADQWRLACPQRTTDLDPMAAHAVDHAGDYAELWDLKEDLNEVFDGRVEVRVNPGCNNDGDVWGGLEAFVRISEADPAPTCCVGPDCTGADFRCEWPATEGAPTPCVAAN